MFTPQEILALVGEKVAIAKPYISNRKETRWSITPEEGRMPEYYPGYNENVDNYHSILVHAEKNVFPSELFIERSPNQTDEEFTYIKNNYKQTTLPVFIDYINSVTRPFHRSNWTLTYQEDEAQFSEETLQAYLEGEVPRIKDLEAYMRHVVPSIKAKDAEGVIAVKPLDLPLMRNDEGELLLDEEGNAQIDDMQLVEPIPVYYNVQMVLDYLEDDHALILLDEKSIVNDGSRNVRVGLVFEFYDDVNIWRVVQTGDRKDFNFQLQLYFTHNCGLPVTKLKGIPTVTTDGFRYESPFLYAVDNLDLVVLNQSNLQASINKCVYPVRVMVGDECDFEDTNGNRCSSGSISYANDDGVWSNYSCPSCHGSGLKSRLSPVGELLIRPDTRNEGQTDSKISNPLEYVSPEVTTLEFLRKEIAEHEHRGRAILHLQTSTDQSNGNVDITATARALDHKATAAFVNPISDQTFDIYEFIIDQMGCQRYGDDYKQPNLVRPTTFDYTTEADYIAMVNSMIEAGAPPIIIHQVLIKYLKTIYANTKMQQAVFNLIVQSDRLLGLTNQDIALKVGRGSISVWEDILHSSSTSLVNELLITNPDFFEQDLAVQREQLIDLAKSKANELGGTSEADIVNSIVGG